MSKKSSQHGLIGQLIKCETEPLHEAGQAITCGFYKYLGFQRPCSFTLLHRSGQLPFMTGVGAKMMDDGPTRYWDYGMRHETFDHSNKSVKSGARNNLRYPILVALGFQDNYPKGKNRSQKYFMIPILLEKSFQFVAGLE